MITQREKAGVVPLRMRYLRSLLVLVALAAWSACAFAQEFGATARDWPMFRGDSRHTGVAKSTLPEKLEVRWTLQCGEAITSTAAIVDGAVYVGSEDQGLFAVDLQTGKTKWQYKTEEAVRAAPTVYRGLVLFGDSEGIVHALDAATGAARWKFTTEAEIVSAANPSGDRIVLGSYDGSIYCLAVADGKLLWKVETEGRVHGTPAIADGRVIAAGCDEHLHVIELSTGKQLPSMSMGSVAGVCAAVDGDAVYIGTYGSRVLAIDWKANKLLWQFSDPDHEFPFMSSAVVADDVIVLGGRDKYLRALDKKTGKQRWALRTRGRIDSSPVLVGERIFVGSADGNLYEVDLKTGAKQWQYETGAPISASPAVASSSLVVGTEDGLLYCFGKR